MQGKVVVHRDVAEENMYVCAFKHFFLAYQ